MSYRELDVPEKYQKLYARAVKGNAKAAIRCHCLMCVGWSLREVNLCTATACPLYSLRSKVSQRDLIPPEVREKRRQSAMRSGLGAFGVKQTTQGPALGGTQTGETGNLA